MSIIAVKVTAQSHDFYIPTWRISGNLHNMSAFQMPDGSVTCNIIDWTAFNLATGMGSSDKQTLVRMMSNLCEELIQYGYYQRSGDVEDRDDAIPYLLQVVSGVYIGVEVDYSYTPLEDALMIVIGNGDAFFYNNHESVNGAYHKYNDTVFLSDSNHVISAVSLYNSGMHGAIEGYSHCGNRMCEWTHYFANNDSNALMNSLVNATWIEPPIPERSCLDMFDLSNRFSPRTKNEGFGCYALSHQDLSDIMNDMYLKVNAMYFTSVGGFMGNPTDYILGCRCYHGMLHDVSKWVNTSTFNVGTYNFGQSWNAHLPAHTPPEPEDEYSKAHRGDFQVVASEFATHDFGILDIPTALASRMRGDYLDYAPFVKYQLYLPYVGYVDLNPNDIIDGKIGILMNVDVISGQGLYVIYTKDNSKHQKVDGTTDSEHVILTIPCQLGIDIPFTENLFQNFVRACVGTLGNAVAIGASAGVAGGMVAAGMASQRLHSINEGTKEGIRKGRINKDAGEAMIAGREAYATQLENEATKGQVAGDALNQAVNMLPSTPDTTRSGGFNGDTGVLGSFNPFIIVTFPIIATPNGFEDIFGNRCAVIDTLSNCSGFTQVVAVKPTNDDVHKCKYKNEIIALLQAGVYL